MKKNTIRESFRSKKKKKKYGREIFSNPYFHGKKTLKQMISEMANDALQNKLKKAPTLINMGGITGILNTIRMFPFQLQL